VLTGAALHRKPLLSWWLPLGVTPALVGGYLIFWV
jgi:hypothetical protein